GGSTRFRAKKVYRGSIVPGEELTVAISRYELKGGQAPFSGTQLETIDVEKILFHKEINPAPLVPSGIKVLSGGKVFGFSQMSNPGPYSLYPHQPPRDEIEDAESVAVARLSEGI